MCAVMEIHRKQREGPLARHQISPVPKAEPDRVSSVGLLGGEIQALRTRSGFCLHEHAPWIPPTRAEQSEGRETEERRLSALSVSLHGAYVTFSESSGLGLNSPHVLVLIIELMNA